MRLVIDFILVSSIVLVLLILLVLVKYKKKNAPQRFLTIIFSVLFFLQFSSYGIFHQIRWLQYVSLFFEGVLLLFGPLIFLYVKSLETTKKVTFKNTLPHFLPYLIYVFVLTIPVLVSAFKKKYIFDYLLFVNEYYYIRDYGELLFVGIYLCFSLTYIYKTTSNLKNLFSIMEYKNIKWLGIFIIGLLTLVVMNMIILSLEIYQGTNLSLDFITVLSFLLFISYLGYFGVNQSQIFIPDYLIKSEFRKDSQLKRVYISQEEILEMDKKISSIFEIQKLFLDDALTLHKLANSLQTSDKKLSFYLNHHLKTNFYDFINKYRVKEFKLILQNQTMTNFSLLGIAFECGFKSKSSFNRIFKKETGLSPSQYKASI